MTKATMLTLLLLVSACDSSHTRGTLPDGAFPGADASDARVEPDADGAADSTVDAGPDASPPSDAARDAAGDAARDAARDGALPDTSADATRVMSLCVALCENAWCGIPWGDVGCAETCEMRVSDCHPYDLARLDGCIGRCDSLYPCVAAVTCGVE
jgi:hypothetical protein